MRRGALVVLIAGIVTALAPSTATAGGWWAFIHTDGKYLGIGESHTWHLSEVFFETAEEASAARHSRQYAYFVRSFDRRALHRAMRLENNPGNWWKPIGDVTLAGTVDLGRWEGKTFAEGTLHLTVPQMPTGKYYLIVCDLGCRTALADLIPTRLTVLPDAATAQAVRKLQRTNVRLRESLAKEQAQSRREVRRLEKQLANLKGDSSLTAAELGRLKEQIAALKEQRSSTPWTAFAGWFIAGAALSALGIGFVRRRSSLSRIPPDVVVPDDARELIESR